MREGPWQAKIYDLFPAVDFVYVENRGAAFGYCRIPMVSIALTVALAVILLYVLKAKKSIAFSAFGCACFAGGSEI